jgi:hypothetical protein
MRDARCSLLDSRCWILVDRCAMHHINYVIEDRVSRIQYLLDTKLTLTLEHF